MRDSTIHAVAVIQKINMTVEEWHQIILSDSPSILKDLKCRYNIFSITKAPVKSWNAIFHGFGGDAEYCIKVVNEKVSGISRTLQDLSYVVDIMQAFKVTGFRPISAPLASKRGKYVERCGGYWVIVFPWISYFPQFGLNEDNAQTAQVVRRAARLMSAMHFAARRGPERIVPPARRDLPQTYKPSLWAMEVDKLWIAAEQNLRRKNSSSEAKELLSRARQIGDELIEQNSWFFDDEPANEMVIHGDFRPENILLGPSGHCWIIDFDLVHCDYPEVDVVGGALNFAGPRWLTGSRNWGVFSSFVRIYRDTLKDAGMVSERLQLALLWSIVRALSLSFKEEQVFGRLNLYYEALDHLRLLKS